MQCALILMAHASFFLVSLATSTCWGLYLRATTRNRRRWILRQSLLRLGWWPVVFSKILDTWCPNPKIVEYVIKYNIYNIYITHGSQNKWVKRTHHHVRLFCDSGLCTPCVASMIIFPMVGSGHWGSGSVLTGYLSAFQADFGSLMQTKHVSLYP